ncbi:MAG: DNA polymerase III subunit delta [Ruminococcus sp.]|nr:DNA polymerase III subunit delta [Ruminococcus sp.]
MAVLPASEIFTSVQNGDVRGLYLFYGKDVAAVAANTAKLFKKLGADLSAVQKYEGDTLDLNELSDAVTQHSMFADRNVIWLHDPNAEEWSAEKLSALLGVLGDVASCTTVVCSITGFDVCGTKKTPSAKHKKLIDFFTKNGIVCQFEQKTAAQLGKSIAERAAKQGCTISRQNAEHLAELCACDTVRLKNELDKLCAYVQSGEITQDTIRQLVARLPDENAFVLARAVVAGNGKAAMAALDQLCAQRAEPVALLSVISMAFLDLYRAKAAQAAGKHQDHITADFSYRGREFAVRNALRDCAKSSLPKLRACVAILCETDAALKSTRTDGRIQIEMAITKMLTAKN